MKLKKKLSVLALLAVGISGGNSWASSGVPHAASEERSAKWIWGAGPDAYINGKHLSMDRQGTLYAIVEQNGRQGLGAFNTVGAEAGKLKWFVAVDYSGGDAVSPGTGTPMLNTPVVDDANGEVYITTRSGDVMRYDITQSPAALLSRAKATFSTPGAEPYDEFGVAGGALAEDGTFIAKGCAAVRDVYRSSRNVLYRFNRQLDQLDATYLGSRTANAFCRPSIMYGEAAPVITSRDQVRLAGPSLEVQQTYDLSTGEVTALYEPGPGEIAAATPVVQDSAGNVYTEVSTGAPMAPVNKIIRVKPGGQAEDFHTLDCEAAANFTRLSLVNDVLYVQCLNKGSVTALDVSATQPEERVRWVFKWPDAMGDSLASVTVSDNGTAYVGTAKSLLALDAATGVEQWRYIFPAQEAHQVSGITLGNDKDGTVYATYCGNAFQSSGPGKACSLHAIKGDGSSLATGKPLANAPKLGGDLANTGRLYTADVAIGAPVVHITVDGHIDDINEGKPVVFEASSSSNPGNAALTYEWRVANDAAQIKLSPRDAARATLSRADIPSADLPVEIKLTVTNPDNGKTGTASYAFTLKAVGKPAGAGLMEAGPLQGKPLAKGTVVEAYVTQQGSSAIVGTKASYEVDVEGDTYLWPARLGSKLEQGNRQRGWLVGEKQGDKIALVPGSSHGNRVWIPGDGQTRYELHIDAKTGPWGWAPVSGTLQVSPQWLNVKQLEAKVTLGDQPICSVTVDVMTDPNDGTLNPYSWPLIVGEHLKKVCVDAHGAAFAVGELVGSGEISPVAGSSYRNLFWKKANDTRDLRLSLVPIM